MSDQGSDSEQRRDKLLLRLLKTPPQTRDQLKADRMKAKITRTDQHRATIGVRVDTVGVVSALADIFCELDPGLAHRFFEYIRKLAPDRRVCLLYDIIEPAYIPMNGTAHNVVSLRIRLPLRADKLEAAFATGNFDGVFGHG